MNGGWGQTRIQTLGRRFEANHAHCLPMHEVLASCCNRTCIRHEAIFSFSLLAQLNVFMLHLAARGRIQASWLCNVCRCR